MRQSVGMDAYMYAYMYAGCMHVICVALRRPYEVEMLARAEAKVKYLHFEFSKPQLLSNQFHVRISPGNGSVKSKYHV